MRLETLVLNKQCFETSTAPTNINLLDDPPGNDMVGGLEGMMKIRENKSLPPFDCRGIQIRSMPCPLAADRADDALLQ